MSVQDLQKDEMMAHLLDALDKKKDIGHYGRLVFAIVARYFMTEDELVKYLQKNPGVSEAEARALVKQVEGRGYSPPRRDRMTSASCSSSESTPDATSSCTSSRFSRGFNPCTIVTMPRTISVIEHS